jgi:hypothetical protein
MRNRVRPYLRNRALGLLAWCLFASAATQACTIFVLADTNRVLFCNNLDWKAVQTRIWFVPSEKHHGCAYAGLVYLGLSGSEGGFNSQGLAFAWVRNRPEKWMRRPEQKIAHDVPHERMLESCATVEEAIAFYTNYWEPAFRIGEMLVADRTGAWAILSAKDGRLEVCRASGSGGFGWGGPVLVRMLPQNAQPTLTNAVQILYAARAGGEYATRYSDVFDLKTGKLFLLLPGRSEAVAFNLADELKRGPHFFDMASIDDQRAAKPKHLSPAAEWIKVIYCPLRYSRPSGSHGPKAALHSPKGCP